MNAWLYLLPALIALATGAVSTYDKSIRESWVYWPALLGSGISLSVLWVLATRNLNDAYKIMLFSLVWDFMMVLAYYVGPVAYKGFQGGLSWQTCAAMATTVLGMAWFKHSIGPQ